MVRTFCAVDASKAERDSPTNRGSAILRGLTKQRFDTIFESGKRVSGRFCRFIALEGDGRIGVATAKTIGSKPRRNSVKRKLKEALRANEQSLQPGIDLVVIGLAACGQASLLEVTDEIAGLLVQLKQRWDEESASS